MVRTACIHTVVTLLGYLVIALMDMSMYLLLTYVLAHYMNWFNISD